MPLAIVGWITAHLVQIIIHLAILFIGYIMMNWLIIPAIIIFYAIKWIIEKILYKTGYTKPFHELK